MGYKSLFIPQLYDPSGVKNQVPDKLTVYLSLQFCNVSFAFLNTSTSIFFWRRDDSLIEGGDAY